MYENSDTVFNLAKPNIDTINETLFNVTNKTDTSDNNFKKINLYFEYSFTRPYPTSSQTAIKHLDYNIYDKDNEKEKKIDVLRELYNALNCNESRQDIGLFSFYSPPLKFTAQNKPKLIKDIKMLNCTFSFNNCFKIGLNKIDYSSSYFSLIINKSEENNINNSNQTLNNNGIQFHTFSEKVSTYTSSYNVVTFYVTFILLIGGYVKQFLSGNPERIQLTEMPEPQPLINLCAGVKIARYSFDLKKEENLYYILIEFMRSPEYLKMITKSSLESFKKRKNIKEDDEFDI